MVWGGSDARYFSDYCDALDWPTRLCWNMGVRLPRVCLWPPPYYYCTVWMYSYYSTVWWYGIVSRCPHPIVIVIAMTLPLPVSPPSADTTRSSRTLQPASHHAAATRVGLDTPRAAAAPKRKRRTTTTPSVTPPRQLEAQPITTHPLRTSHTCGHRVVITASSSRPRVLAPPPPPRCPPAQSARRSVLLGVLGDVSPFPGQRPMQQVQRGGEGG